MRLLPSGNRLNGQPLAHIAQSGQQTVLVQCHSTSFQVLICGSQSKPEVLLVLEKENLLSLMEEFFFGEKCRSLQPLILSIETSEESFCRLVGCSFHPPEKELMRILGKCLNREKGLELSLKVGEKIGDSLVVKWLPLKQQVVSCLPGKGVSDRDDPLSQDGQPGFSIEVRRIQKALKPDLLRPGKPKD